MPPQAQANTKAGSARAAERPWPEDSPLHALPPGADPSLEDACGRISRMTCRVLRADAAVVTLVDGSRPFVAGAHGLPEGTPWGKTPLSLSLATHTGAEGEALALDDVSHRELLAQDPLVAEAGFRSFLALPVRLGGETLGTLCALSRRARSWEDEDVELLADLTDSVVTELRLRGSLRQIRAVEAGVADRARQAVVSLVDGIDAVVSERDLQSGRFVFVSRKAESLTGYPVERWTEEEDFWRSVLVHSDDRKRVEAGIRRTAATGESADLLYRIIRADGEVLWVRDLVRIGAGTQDGSDILRGVMVDVTEQQETETSLRLMQELAFLANAPESRERMEGAFEEALAKVRTHTGWDAGHVYLREGKKLVPSGIWTGEGRVPALREVTMTSTFSVGEGLPGQVARSGRPVWLEDVQDRPDFQRRGAAASDGISAAFAFPVLVGDEVSGVVEFFTREPREPDERLLELVGSVGTVLGRIRERIRSEEGLRRAELLARQTVETAPLGFLSMDREGRVLEWNRESERIFGWSREEALGRPGVELFLPADHGVPFMEALTAIAEGLDLAETSSEARSLEIEGVRRDGAMVPVELAMTALSTGEHLRFNVFVRDVREERAQDRERRRRERQLAQAQRLAHLGSWEWQMETNTLHWSDELHEIFGTDPGTFVPTFDAYLERIHPEDRELVEGVVSVAAETGEDFMFEHRVVRPGGEDQVVLCQGRVETDSEGRPVSLQGTTQDITGRKELEERERALAAEQAARNEAEAAEARIRQILDSITDAFFTVDGEWRFTYANREAERLLGKSGSELKGVSVWHALPETRGTRFEEEYRRAVAEDRPVEFEAYDPSLERWLEVRAYPSERGLSIYFHDISARRQAEAELRASEARYRFLSDSIPQHVWTAAPDGSVDYMNRVMREFLGAEPGELGDTLSRLFHPDDGATARWRSAIEEGTPLELEARLVPLGDGEPRWYLVRARPQLSSDGQVLRWFGTNTDIHEQKGLEQERAEAMEELERVTHILTSERQYLQEQTEELRRTARALRKTNEELDQFAYVASHDLKAPLRGISNLAQWLAEDLGDDVSEEIGEYVDLLQGRVHRMEDLIDGILEYSRAGRVRQQPEEVDVRALVPDVIDMVAPPERFEIHTGSYFPTLRTLRIPLEQVLLNLVGNAVKHADGEAPRVSVTCSDEGEEFYEFSVSDNGPGIDPEFQDRIWTIFQTLKPRDEVEGTGIGLSVVQRTVEYMGGQVWVESQPGQGATFRFLWPRGAAPDPSDQNPNPTTPDPVART